MEKTEWPTAARLAELREAGRFPYSKIATGFIALSAVVISSFLLSPTWKTILGKYKKLFASGLRNEGITEWLLFLDSVLVILHTLAWSVMILLIMYVLLFSRFLFRLSFLHFDLSRLNPFREREAYGFAVRFLISFICWVIAVAFGASIFFLAAKEILGLLNNNYIYVMAWPDKIFGMSVAITSLVALVLAAVTSFLSWRLFMGRHKMTLRELRDEMNQ